jgi:hypothetical protein
MTNILHVFLDASGSELVKYYRSEKYWRKIMEKTFIL